MKPSSVLRPAIAAVLLAAAVAPLSLIAAETPGGQSVAEGLRIRSDVLGRDVELCRLPAARLRDLRRGATRSSISSTDTRTTNRAGSSSARSTWPPTGPSPPGRTARR